MATESRNKPGPRARPPSENASENVSARIMPAEKRALDQLVRLRAADLASRGEPPDDSFAGWLRATIRQQAIAKGISLDELGAAAASRRPPKGTSK